MKRLIRKILKEEIQEVDKKLCDKVVDKLLSYVFTKEVKDDRRSYSFGSIGDMLDQHIMEEEFEDIVNIDENFKSLGWDYNYDEDDPYDEGEYYRVDTPNMFYTYEEFQIEVFYDWLHNLVEEGKLEYDENLGTSGEWVLPKKDILIRMKYCNFGCGLEYNYLHESYTIGGCGGTGNRIEIMKVIQKDFGIDDSELVECIVTSFIDKLPQRINENGLLSNYSKTYIYQNNNTKTIKEGVIDDFIEFGKGELDLDDDFRVNLTSNGDDIETLANYDMADEEINVLTKDRAVPDIIRSIAHEMVHHKQNERGDLRGNPEEGEDGSPWEDEANSKAGVLVRRFGKIKPEIYDL